MNVSEVTPLSPEVLHQRMEIEYQAWLLKIDRTEKELLRPPCFDSLENWLRWLYAAQRGRISYPEESYCLDCTPEFKRQKIKERKCARRETVFYWRIYFDKATGMYTAERTGNSCYMKEVNWARRLAKAEKDGLVYTNTEESMNKLLQWMWRNRISDIEVIG